MTGVIHVADPINNPVQVAGKRCDAKFGQSGTTAFYSISKKAVRCFGWCGCENLVVVAGGLNFIVGKN